MRVFLMALLVSAFAIFADEAHSQAPDTIWTKTYGGTGADLGFSVQLTDDGGYIMTGHTDSFHPGDFDVYLIKTDASGDVLWTRTYGGSGHDVGWSVQQTADHGYIIAGETGSYGAGDFDVWLIKTDAFGSMLWARTYGGTHDDWAESVQQLADGGYIIAGSTHSFYPGTSYIYLIRTESNGDTLWTRIFGGVSNDRGYSVRETSDGGFIVAGWSVGAGAEDVYVVKVDASGDTLWSAVYGTENPDLGFSVERTVDDGYILAGKASQSYTGYYDALLTKIDASGRLIWSRTYGGEHDDVGYSVNQTADGGYIVAGYSLSFTSPRNADVYLIKTDVSGNTIWTSTYGGESLDKAYSIQNTADGGYIVAGFTRSFGAGDYDVWLIRLGPEQQEIPTLSEWGVIVLALLLLAAGTAAFIRRRSTACPET